MQTLCALPPGHACSCFLHSSSCCDLLPCLQAPRQQTDSQATHTSKQQGPSQHPSLKQTQAFPTPSLPPAPLAPQNQQAVEPLHKSSISSGQPGLQQPTAGSAPAAAGGAPLLQALHPQRAWQGHLAKSGLLKCKAECFSVSPADSALQWPAVLDVRARVVVTHALDLPKQHAPQHLVIRCIVSTREPKNEQDFHVFCQYLTEKQRAGVVNLGSRSSKHDLFLVPGASEVYQQLHIQNPNKECLVAITTLKQ